MWLTFGVFGGRGRTQLFISVLALGVRLVGPLLTEDDSGFDVLDHDAANDGDPPSSGLPHTK